MSIIRFKRLDFNVVVTVAELVCFLMENATRYQRCNFISPGDHGQQRPGHGLRLADGGARQPEGQSANHLPGATKLRATTTPHPLQYITRCDLIFILCCRDRPGFLFHSAILEGVCFGFFFHFHEQSLSFSRLQPE